MTTEATGRRVTFRLPLPPRVLGSNGAFGSWKAHGAAEKRYKADCLWAIAETGWTLREPPMQRATISLHWVYCRTQRTGRYCPVDAANAIAAFKKGQDALVAAGVLVDDHHRVLTQGPVTFERHAGHKPGQCEGSGVYVTLIEQCG